MKKKTNHRILVAGVALMLLLPTMLCAQNESPEAQLRRLRESAERLKTSEDSLAVLLQTARTRYAAADEAGKEAEGEVILDLEAKIFSLHSSLDDVMSQIGELGEVVATSGETTMPNIGGATEDLPDHKIFNNSQGEDYRLLIKNKFFVDNLPADVYASLIEAHAMEVSTGNYLQIITRQYSKMIELDSVFHHAPSAAEAMEAYNEFNRLDMINSQINDSIAVKQSKIIDAKSYAYNLILDKFERNVMMDEFSKWMSDAMAELEEVTDLSYSKAVAQYPIYKELILTYENAMAKALSLFAATDSTATALALIDKRAYLFPPIVGPAVEPGVEYADAIQGNSSPYSTSNPIPEAVIPTSGVVYRLLVGSYTQRQAINIFRNASPLSVERKEDKRYYYYVGCYPNFVSATAAVDSLRAMGFRQPRVVGWSGSRYVAEPTEELAPQSPRIVAPMVAEESESGQEATTRPAGNTTAAVSSPAQNTATTTSTTRYRVEIGGAGSSLSSEVRSAISAAAPGKEITRLVDGASGQTIFTVGSFTSREDGERVAAAISQASAVLTVTITEIGK